MGSDLVAAFASDYGLALAALVLSFVTIVVSVVMQSRSLVRTASAEYVHRLEERVRECELDREKLHAELEDVERELRRERADKLALLERIVRLEKANGS